MDTLFPIRRIRGADRKPLFYYEIVAKYSQFSFDKDEGTAEPWQLRCSLQWIYVAAGACCFLIGLTIKQNKAAHRQAGDAQPYTKHALKKRNGSEAFSERVRRLPVNAAACCASLLLLLI